MHIEVKDMAKEYLNVDLTGYKTYLQAAAEQAGMSVTKYIRELIRKDYELHKDEAKLIAIQKAQEALEAAKRM